MARSVLLQLARDSIQEVFEAKRTIDKVGLLQKHPLLGELVASSVNIYLKGELRGSALSSGGELSLLEEIIQNAKKAVFEDKDFSPLTTSEYLDCEVEIVLYTNEGNISEKDDPILNEKHSLESLFL